MSEDKKPVKVGDEVNIRDGSWSYLLKDGVLLGSQDVGVIEKKVWKVVAVDCVLPTHTDSFSTIGILRDYGPNNIVLIDESDNIVFSRQDYAQLATFPVCPTCGQERK